MSTDLYKVVLFNDGEGLTHGDFNDAQRFLSAKLTDQALEKLVGARLGADSEFNSLNGANVATAWAYALTVGGANLAQGSANNKIKIAAGTLFQKLASADGNSSTFVPFTFDGTAEVTIANGDPSNPRVDLIQMQLAYTSDDSQSRDFEDGATHVVTTTSMNKKYQITCTLTIKQGTPGAAPAYPAADSGTVPIGAVLVPTNYAAGGAFIYSEQDTPAYGVTHPVIHDLRIPLGIKKIRVPASAAIFNSTKWSRNDSTSGRDNVLVAVPSTIVYNCPLINGRLLGVDVVTNNASNVTSFLSLVTVQVTGPWPLSDVSALLTTGGTLTNKHGGASTIETEGGSGLTSGVGPVVTGNGTHTPPIWCNGHRSPKEERTVAGGNADSGSIALYIAASVSASATEVGDVTFYIATGL